MLPSKGYFSNLSCPFYELDSCDRPHCHFKHSKKDKDVGRVNEIVSAVDATVVDEINANEKNNQLIKELVKETVKQVLSHSEIRESNDSIIDTNTIVDEVVSNLSNQNLNSTVTTANVTSSVQTAAAISSSATPSYRPTPISELSRRHIPVQYAPAKPTTISLSSRKISDKTITYIPSASKTNNSISNNDIMKCSSLNQSVAAYVPAGCEQSYEPEYLPTKIISSESLQRLSDDDEYEISSSPVYNSAADIQPPDSPLTYTPQSSSLSDHIASCSYQPSPIKQHNLIINSDISNDQLENKIKHSASKDEKTGAGDAKQKSINEQCSMKKDKKKCETSDRSNKISSSNKSKSSGKLKEIKHDKDKDFSKSADSSHDSHNKTSSDKVKSKSTSKEHLLKNKSSNDEENKNKRYKESTDRENKSKCLNDEQKRRHKHVKDSAHKSKHSSKSSNVDEKKYKHNRELDRESKFSSSDESKKRKHNQAFDGENKSSSSSGRSSSECHKKKHKQQSSDSETSKVKRNADQLPSASNHPHHKLEKETAKDGSKRLKEECSYSSSSDVELVTEKSPCILINDSSNSSDEETHKDEKKPKLSVSGGSLPYQNLGPSTSRFSLTSSSCSFSERWRKAKEQVQRPHPAGKIKICSVPNVTSLLTAKDKLLAQAHKPSTQPVHSLKFNSSVEEVAQPKAVKQRIAHKQAEELPKCILDPSVKLPYTARQLCLNTMYEVCLQFLLPDEAKELVLTTELDIAKRVNALKTYQNSMALAVLKIRKTKGESNNLLPVML
ncbi:hypothetical protein O3M35_013210 [Rhynocoris fuscipes]|uniref:Uncharacterized protein n=1 Tax=Rhynocoris fuscipes TaxID=488301 RepID=A0AAW1CEW8_9HEMI